MFFRKNILPQGIETEKFHSVHHSTVVFFAILCNVRVLHLHILSILCKRVGINGLTGFPIISRTGNKGLLYLGLHLHGDTLKLEFHGVLFWDHFCFLFIFMT